MRLYIFAFNSVNKSQQIDLSSETPVQIESWVSFMQQHDHFWLARYCILPTSPHSAPYATLSWLSQSAKKTVQRRFINIARAPARHSAFS
jgi:hypothetical protein